MLATLADFRNCSSSAAWPVQLSAHAAAAGAAAGCGAWARGAEVNNPAARNEARARAEADLMGSPRLERLPQVEGWEGLQDPKTSRLRSRGLRRGEQPGRQEVDHEPFGVVAVISVRRLDEGAVAAMRRHDRREVWI